MGTRFLAMPEAPALATHTQAIFDAKPGATAASPICDIFWGDVWPGVQVRAIQNHFTERWVGREDELRAAVEKIRRERERAGSDEDPQEMVLLAGEGSGQIHNIIPAGQVVREIVAEAARLVISS
jgi:nitronate monooxygenase